MPLMNPKKSVGSLVVANPTAQEPVQVPQLSTTSTSFEGVTVDTRWQSIESLMTHIAGSAWTVDYYSQVITTDSSLGGQRPTSSPLYQQYIKIEKLVMRVTEPLTLSQDPITKAMTYVGRAIVHAYIPNEADVFTAAIAGGTLAIFRVLSSEKKSVFQQTAYEIAYEVSTEDVDFVANLESKVVETRTWREELIPYGKSPVILKSADALLTDAQNLVQVVLPQYFDRFFSRDFSTLIVPQQQYAIYDPYLTVFMTQMLNSDDCIEMMKMKVLNVKEDPVYLQNNLWKALAHQDELYLQSGFTRAGITETGRFESNPFFSGIRFTAVPFVVYPKDPTVGIEGVITENIKPISDSYAMAASTGGSSNLFEDPNTGALPDVQGAPGLYHVTFDDYYVLSQNFYDQTQSQSVLESLVRQHLKREAIDLTQLINTAKMFNSWGLVEQFYYLPIILVLIRGAKFTV
jgi:hypothetical protein